MRQKEPARHGQTADALCEWPFFDGTVVVTGGGARRGGISRRTIERLVFAGARVGFADSDPRGKELMDELPEGKSLFVQGDLRQLASAKALVKAVADEFGPPSIVVNMVGGANGKCTFRQTKSRDMRLCYELNVVTAVNLVRAALPYLETVDGDKSIVTIGSINGDVGYLLEFPYACAKHALRAAVRNWGMELADRGIRSNLIAAGSVPNVNSKTWGPRLQNPDMRAHLEDSIPLGRWGTPDDIANAVLFLASPLARWITAEVLRVDGGVIKCGRGRVRHDGQWYLPLKETQHARPSKRPAKSRADKRNRKLLPR